MRLTRILQKEFSSLDKLLKIRSENLHPSVQKATNFKKPVYATRGNKQWIFDDKSGKKYLDFFGGIVTVGVGHCHPKVNEALINQVNTLWHTTNIYVNEPVHEYAEMLTKTFPGNLKVVYPVNSGSEANDLAVLMARVATGNFDVVALRNSYHGMSPITMGLTGLSNWKQAAPHYMGVHHAMNPDVYKGIFGGCRDSPVQTDRDCSGTCTANYCTSSDKYIEQLDELLTYTIPQKKVAGFFLESIQGVGGVVQFPNGYVKKAFELVRKNGGLCISDEVQTGFGRTGDNMWHFQDHGVIPDIVTVAKSIGNGFPMAACITTPEVAKSLSAVSHFNTFGGNPMGCAAAKAVLEVIKEEKFQENSKKVGTYLLQELAKFRKEFNFVGDVRGKGLMIGIEMVNDKKTRAALPLEQVLNVFEEIKDQGLLVGRGGYAGNVFRIAPPMCITKEDADMALDILRKSFQKHSK